MQDASKTSGISSETLVLRVVACWHMTLELSKSQLTRLKVYCKIDSVYTAGSNPEEAYLDNIRFISCTKQLPFSHILHVMLGVRAF